MRLSRSPSILLTILLLVCNARGQSVTYNASSNVLPQPPFMRFDFDFVPFGSIFGFNAPQSVGGGIYEMGPTLTEKYTFWFTNSIPLDHTRIVEVSARLKLISQSSANPSARAGLALSFTDDRNLYNELYINETEVFINKRVGNERVRDVAFSTNTTSAFHDYTMRLSNDVLKILIDGTEVLSGSLFDANGLNLPTLPNWAVVGDITQSAASTWQMQSFSIAVIPEPSEITGLIAAGLIIRRRDRLRSGQQRLAS